VAIDAATTMLDVARTRVRDAGLVGRIELLKADAKHLPFADGEFDGVLSNTILHHIPEPLDFVREAARVLAPTDATLVIRDLFRPPTETEAWRIVDRHAAEADPRQRRLLFDSLHAALTLDEARRLVEAAGLADAIVEMTSDRHYTITLVR
jgi:ubiquinone/menaquinone biosynthesis C-methylase UbiE